MFFYFYQVLLVVFWLETLNTLGYVLALEKVSYQLINPTYLFRGLSSALRARHGGCPRIMKIGQLKLNHCTIQNLKYWIYISYILVSMAILIFYYVLLQQATVVKIYE